jgi:probable rRNA maturation factor
MVKINKKSVKCSVFFKLQKKDLLKIFETVLSYLNIRQDFEISVVFCDDNFIYKYNKQYRDKDKATNVLSFCSDEFMKENGYLGDVIISLETIEKEAYEQSKTNQDHLTHIFIHSILHLLGHDHEIEDQRIAMEDIEIKILASIGISNPYEIE